MNCLEGSRRSRLCNAYRRTIRQRQLCIDLFTEAQLSGLGDAGVINHIEYCDDRHTVLFPVNLDLAQRLKTLAAVGFAITMQKGDILPVCIDSNAAKFQGGHYHSLAIPDQLSAGIFNT